MGLLCFPQKFSSTHLLKGRDILLSRGQQICYYSIHLMTQSSVVTLKTGLVLIMRVHHLNTLRTGDADLGF